MPRSSLAPTSAVLVVRSPSQPMASWVPTLLLDLPEDKPLMAFPEGFSPGAQYTPVILGTGTISKDSGLVESLTLAFICEAS